MSSNLMVEQAFPIVTNVLLLAMLLLYHMQLELVHAQWSSTTKNIYCFPSNFAPPTAPTLWLNVCQKEHLKHLVAATYLTINIRFLSSYVPHY